MTLILLESKADKLAAQANLIKHMQAAWNKNEHRRVTWRPSSRDLDIVHNNEFWFVAVPLVGKQGPGRYWNSIGSYQKNGNLQITVEINVPIDSNKRTCAGFFAKDDRTGVVYLMHDGSVGGGQKGVGKIPFLAWTGEKLVPAIDSQGGFRLGILVAPITPRVIAPHIVRFAQKVQAFKMAVRNNEISDDDLTKKSRESYADYYKEFSGKKKGGRAKEFEYISRHGDIVDALCQWRKKKGARKERIIKNAYIDMGVAIGDKITEIYEVKTSAERQTLYTAIGQILVHGSSDKAGILRYLVVPDDGTIPQDVGQALKQLFINVLRFNLTDDSVSIM